MNPAEQLAYLQDQIDTLRLAIGLLAAILCVTILLIKRKN